MRLLSFSVTDSLLAPMVAGVKSMGSVQEALAARLVEEEQTWPPVESSGKSSGVARPEKISGALPLFETVTACGLSVLLEPTAVVLKLSAGGVA